MLGTKLPRADWLIVIRRTALMTALAMGVSLVASQIIMLTISQGLDFSGVVVALGMPVLLGTPMMFYLLLGRQRLKHANVQLEVLASVDWLTNCLNRREFTTRVSAELAAPPKTGGVNGCALMLLDADHFKLVNDRFGHDRGDEALQLMAKAIIGAIRREDIVGRLGGEEFGIFAHGVGVEEATAIAERVRAAVAGAVFAPGGVVHPLSVSIGSAMCQRGDSFTSVFQLADQRLYNVKHSGRNRDDNGQLEPKAPSSQAA